MKYLFMVLLSFNALAEHELNLSYSRIDQDLLFRRPIKFDMNAIFISYSYYTKSGFGAEVGAGRTTETENSVKLSKMYENKINALWSASLAYKYELTNDINLKAGFGITEYHSTWKVNGKEPVWSKGTDSHKPSYFIAAQYRLYKNLYLECSVRKMYEKMKEGKGREVTRSANIGFTYVF